MAIELHPKDALIMAALATKRPIAFLVGSPLSQKDGAGVPGVKQMLDFARDEIRERIAFALPSFEAALPKTSDAEDYQAAMRWLGVRAGQDAINDVIARAVLQARKPATGDLAVGTDGQPEDWNIPPGTTGLAELVARGGEKFTGPILTTNFDPLLSLAVRKSGGRAGRRVLTADGTLAGAAEDDPGICNIVHLHGFWRDSDTLHTQAQLTNPRPKLKASLQRLLVARQRTLIVAAYGGWDDVFTQSLVELMNDEQAKLDVIWCFYESDPVKIEERYGNLLKAVSPAIVLNRFRPFGGIDCHSIFAEILSVLRGMSSPAVVASSVMSPLAGWEQVDTAYLDALPALTQDDVIKYFDGAVPTWRHAVSQAIPRRQPLTAIANRLATFESGKGDCSVQLIRAAGGEGKSTLLLQAASDAVRRGTWTVLWRPSPHGRLLGEHLIELDVAKQWLLVADDAETLVDDLKEAAVKLHTAGRSNVHFLLAARDVDWRAHSGDKPEWETWLNAWVSRQRSIILRGINPDDALLVVDAWSRYGSDGLRELAKLAGTAERVTALTNSVRESTDNHVALDRRYNPDEGSFFGGLLTVRFGQNGLHAHVRAFLDRLKGDPIQGSSHSLFDALLYVAACHAVGIPGLNETVLADMVGVSRDWVQTLIVNPLGEEAAAVRSAGHVLSRHGKVAVAILVAAEEDFGADIAEVWSAVVKQTVRTSRDVRVGETFAPIVHAGPRLQTLLPKRFSKERRKEIAVAAARASIAAEPERLSPIVDLGRTYRNAADFTGAILVFRENLNDLSSKSDFDSDVRGYWYEWAVSEGRGNAEREHALASVWLAGLALSDHLSNASVTEDNAKMICAGLGVSLGALEEPAFHYARRAIAYLGRITARDPRTLSYFDKHDRENDKVGTPYPKSIEEAIDWLTLAVAQAGRELRDPFLNALLKPELVSFNILHKTLNLTRPSRLRVDTLPTNAKTTPAVDTRLQQPLSDFEARVKAGIERVLKEAWAAIPPDVGEKERYKIARRNAAQAISRLSPHIKRRVSAYFETQKWQPLEAFDKKP